MAGGFLGLEASLAAPFGNEGEKAVGLSQGDINPVTGRPIIKRKGQYRDVRPNPFVAAIVPALQRRLSPKFQAQRTKRTFGAAREQSARGYDTAINSTRENLSSRGLGRSGIGLGTESLLRQQEAQQASLLPILAREQFEQNLSSSQQQAAAFLDLITRLRLAARGVSDQANALKADRKLAAKQQTIGLIGSILGGVGGAIGGGV